MKRYIPALIAASALGIVASPAKAQIEDYGYVCAVNPKLCTSARPNVRPIGYGILAVDVMWPWSGAWWTYYLTIEQYAWLVAVGLL